VRVGYFVKKPAIASGDEVSPLTHREKEILRLLADGYTVRDIASRMGISLSTARRHQANVRFKLEQGRGRQPE
jgi:DNA-binding CsgD family transcriptional regulator